MAFLMASLSCSLSVSRTPATTEHAGRKKKKVILERRRSSRCGGRHLTFEDNLQFVPQNIEDAVAGAGLWDDVPFQPPPTRVLVEIVTWLHRCVHVLQQSSRFEARCGGHKQGGGGGGRGQVTYGEKRVLQGTDAVPQSSGKETPTESAAQTRPLTCSNTVCSGAHGVEAGLEQLSWKKHLFTTTKQKLLT